jgi:hypothetical protein
MRKDKSVTRRERDAVESNSFNSYKSSRSKETLLIGQECDVFAATVVIIKKGDKGDRER